MEVSTRGRCWRDVRRGWGSCCTSGRESSSCTALIRGEGVGVGVGSGLVTMCLSNVSSFPNLLFQKAKRAGNEEKNFAVSQAGLASPQICPPSPTSKQGALLTRQLFGFLVCFFPLKRFVRGPGKLKQQNLQCQGVEPHSPVWWTWARPKALILQH